VVPGCQFAVQRPAIDSQYRGGAFPATAGALEYALDIRFVHLREALLLLDGPADFPAWQKPPPACQPP
jgi:hypothetical protein